MDDLISRQMVIDTLNIDAELLKRALDDIYVVGAERAEYEWGLGLIESCISDVKELPSAEQEIIRCGNCKYYNTEERLCSDLMGFGRYWSENDFCSFAERRTDGTD